MQININTPACLNLAEKIRVRGTVQGVGFRPTVFTITQSVSNTVKTGITPDAATCLQCRAEIFDFSSRWYRYPFTNCTHCGSRLSIVRVIPYARDSTSMADFTMCADCAREYRDVTNRRFHVQPVACQVCGSHVWLEKADGTVVTDVSSALDDVDAARILLQRGKIVAIKGIIGITYTSNGQRVEKYLLFVA